MKSFLVRVIKRHTGKKWMQRISELLFHLSLAGMNYGGINLKTNGELHLLRQIKKRYPSNEPLTIFDVGANIGNYSKALHEIFGERVTIHSFEPSQKTFDHLKKTTSGMNNIISNNFGLSNDVGCSTLYSDNDASGLASLYQRNLDHHNIVVSQNEKVTLSTIDKYCADNQINKIHFMKLDVEGHELKVLEGACRMLHEKRIDCIQFEFGGCNIDSRVFFRDLYLYLKDNYRIYRILKNGLIEISNYNERHEIFLYANYFADKKKM
jgi:FkbM family methyltransferase